MIHDLVILLTFGGIVWCWLTAPCWAFGHRLVPSVTRHGADCLKCKKFFPMEIKRP